MVIEIIKWLSLNSEIFITLNSIQFLWNFYNFPHNHHMLLYTLIHAYSKNIHCYHVAIMLLS